MTYQIKKVRSQARYEIGFKRKLAKLYLSGYGSYRVIAEEYGLANKGVVKEFVKWYKKELEKATFNEIMTDDTTNKPASTAHSSDALSAENARLRHLLKQAQLKAEALETMIDIAEADLQINIRKKSGAKPSKK